MSNKKIFFIINTNSGNSNTDWSSLIKDYFKSLDYTIELFYLSKDSNVQTIKEKIKAFSPQIVVAVGGDGTVTLAAESILEQDITLGILPAGSANGMAKELGISEAPLKALEILVNGQLKKIHILKVNDHLCLHLSDIGINAYAIKKFESENKRGMWGYVKASLKVLWQNPTMDVTIQLDDKTVRVKAEMIVVANATKYGSGVIINPVGNISDELFEVVAIKKISLYEIFKMNFMQSSNNSEKIEIFQTKSLLMNSRKKVHFQVDGEYLGKVNKITASILPNALNIIVPSETI